MNPFKNFWRKISHSLSPSSKKIRKQKHLDKYLVHGLNRSKIPNLKQIKSLPKILDRREKILFGISSIILLICIISLIFQGYLALTIVIPKEGGEYVEGLIGSPKFINPILSQTNDVDTDLSSLIFSGLLKRDAERQLVPDLAESYEISEDQLVYTFYLRRDVRWHDGMPFKSDDVIFTVASIQDQEFNSPLSRSFRGIVAERIDDYTLKFTLPEPYAPFLGLLTFGILPEHLWYSVPPANSDLAELNKRPIGTGPWKFDLFKKDKSGAIKSYTLARNDDYYGVKPFLKKITFKFYGDFISAVEALKNKDVQGIAYLPKEYQTELKKYKNINYYNLEQPQYTAVFFNQQKNELLAADYIRQVLALATDKESIIRDAFNEEGKTIDCPTLPGIGANPEITIYEYDPEKAIAILEKNDWTMTSTTTEDGVTHQVRKKKDWYLEITLTTVDQPENVKTAEIIKQSWDQIGIKTTLDIIDKSKIIQEAIKPREYEALLFGENIGSDPDPFSFWHSSQNEYPGLNLAIFTNKEVDKLLEEARKTNNWEERKRSYSEFQKIVSEKLPAIFLYNPTYTYPQDKKIKGFDVLGIADPADRFANISQWYIKTRRIWK